MRRFQHSRLREAVSPGRGRDSKYRVAANADFSRIRMQRCSGHIGRRRYAQGNASPLQVRRSPWINQAVDRSAKPKCHSHDTRPKHHIDLGRRNVPDPVCGMGGTRSESDPRIGFGLRFQQACWPAAAPARCLRHIRRLARPCVAPHRRQQPSLRGRWERKFHPASFQGR